MAFKNIANEWPTAINKTEIYLSVCIKKFIQFSCYKEKMFSNLVLF
jgi:hypothetical protein